MITPLNCNLWFLIFFFFSLTFFLPLFDRQIRSPAATFSNPAVISHLIGILSGVEILAVFFFILFLAWTFYSRISQDFKKLAPFETLKLDL